MYHTSTLFYQNPQNHICICMSNLGGCQAGPGEHCDHNINHHKVDRFSSIVSRHNKLHEWPQPVPGVWSENLERRRNSLTDSIHDYSIISFKCLNREIVEMIYVYCEWKDLMKSFTSSVLMISFEMKSLMFRGVAGFASFPCRNFIHGGSSQGRLPCYIHRQGCHSVLLCNG